MLIVDTNSDLIMDICPTTGRSEIRKDNLKKQKALIYYTNVYSYCLMQNHQNITNMKY